TITAGAHTVRLKSAYGTVQQQVTISAAAPAIFLLNAPSFGAVLNQDYSINTQTAPLPRGQALQIYATGLGTTTRQGQFNVTTATVTVSVNGTELPALYSGLAPGYLGLYQVNVLIPTNIPPGSGVSLMLKEAGQTSNAILVSLR